MAELPSIRVCTGEESDMDEGTRDAAGDAIADAKRQLEQAAALLDRYPDNVLALESAITLAKAAVLALECPVEE